MKRITLSFVALALTILTANAQFKKSWDFTKGLSDETIANLKADGSHWAENGNDADGNVNNWKNVGKPATDSYLTANGTVIPELEGLYFDIGSNKDNSIHIATTKLRLTRKGTKITFPKLANGQKITFVGRSANSTATNRGIAPVQDYIKFVEGEQTDGQSIFIGGGVEGSLGTYTFVYQVVTESTDSVDVQFQLTPDAGIDFTLFQIDEGDAPEVEEAKNVAYIYSGEDPSIDDYAYIYVSSLDGVTPTIIKGSDEITLDSLQAYDLVVVSPTVQPTDAIVPVLKSAIAYEPMLNLNASLYEAWGLGSAVESETGTATVNNTEHPLFENIDLSEGLQMLDGGNITGVNLSDYFAADDIIATAGDVVAIHSFSPMPCHSSLKPRRMSLSSEDQPSLRRTRMVRPLSASAHPTRVLSSTIPLTVPTQPPRAASMQNHSRSQNQLLSRHLQQPTATTQVPSCLPTSLSSLRQQNQPSL